MMQQMNRALISSNARKIHKEMNHMKQPQKMEKKNEKGFKETWLRTSIMITPSRVLGNTTCDNPPIMAFNCKIAYLEWHFSHQLIPPFFNKVHNRRSLLRCGQRGQNQDTITKSEPSEVQSLQGQHCQISSHLSLA